MKKDSEFSNFAQEEIEVKNPKINSDSSSIEKFIYKSLMFGGVEEKFSLSGDISEKLVGHVKDPSKEPKVEKKVNDDEVKCSNESANNDENSEQEKKEFLKNKALLENAKKENISLKVQLQEQIAENASKREKEDKVENLLQNLNNEITEISNNYAKKNHEMSSDVKELIIGISKKIADYDDDSDKKLERMITESLKLIPKSIYGREHEIVIKLSSKMAPRMDMILNSKNNRNFQIIACEDFQEFDYMIDFNEGKIEHMSANLWNEIDKIIKSYNEN